jgi:hypothetical protein
MKIIISNPVGSTQASTGTHNNNTVVVGSTSSVRNINTETNFLNGNLTAQQTGGVNLEVGSNTLNIDPMVPANLQGNEVTWLGVLQDVVNTNDSDSLVALFNISPPMGLHGNQFHRISINQTVFTQGYKIQIFKNGNAIVSNRFAVNVTVQDAIDAYNNIAVQNNNGIAVNSFYKIDA